MGDLPGPGSGRARPPFAGAPNCCYTPIQRQTLTTEEYTLSLPLSCLKSGTTSWKASEIRGKVTEFFPGIHNLVLELRSDGTDTWAGFGPKSDDKNMFNWILQHWGK